MRFSAGPLTDDTVTTTDSPPVILNRAPVSASTTSDPQTTSPTFSLAVSAPATPTEISVVGLNLFTTASAALRAAFRPMPPTAITAFSNSKNSTPSNHCPWVPRSSGANSLRIAATTAMLLRGIAVRPEPLHCSLQCSIHGARTPSQFAFGLGTGDEHLLASHAHGIQRHARLAFHHPASDQGVDYARGIGNCVRQP